MIFLKQKKTIILASTSSVRKKVLSSMGVYFKVIAPLFDEEIAKKQNKKLSIKDLALLLAMHKAKSISSVYKDSIVIGCDQICELEGVAIDKPKNKEDSIKQLKILNAKTHYQNNALVVMENDKIIFQKFSKAKLKMRKISDEDIEKYFEIDNPIGCAGSYKYESFGAHLFKKVEGDYHAILGLNIQSLLYFLHKKKYITIK